MFKFKKKIGIFILILFMLFVFSVIFAIININNENILDGIFIGGIDVSNMSKDDAYSKISKSIENREHENIKISILENDEININFNDFNINYDINSSINDAFNIGRHENIFKNNFDILKLKLKPKKIDLKFQIEEDKISSIIDDITSKLQNKMIQSSYYIEENNLIIEQGKKGNSIDDTDFKNKLFNLLNDLSTKNYSIDLKIIEISPDKIDIDKIYKGIYKEPKNAYYEEEPFKVYNEITGISFDKKNAYKLLETEQEKYIIPLQITKPEITTSDLNINIFHDMLATFTTKYDLSNEDRTTNLELAASKIDGTILNPNEKFSYNKIVGARTISAGYKEAKIYSNGEVVDGIRRWHLPSILYTL